MKKAKIKKSAENIFMYTREMHLDSAESSSYKVKHYEFNTRKNVVTVFKNPLKKGEVVLRVLDMETEKWVVNHTFTIDSIINFYYVFALLLKESTSHFAVTLINTKYITKPYFVDYFKMLFNKIIKGYSNFALFSVYKRNIDEESSKNN